MKYLLTSVLFLFYLTTSFGATTDLGTKYIEAWKKFYPSKALDQGIHTAIFDYEDLTPETIEKWLAFNKKTFAELSDQTTPYVIKNRIDARLLRVQIQAEIDKWHNKKVHQTSLALYTRLISKAIDKVLAAKYLTTSEQNQLICERLTAVQNLCLTAKNSLQKDNKKALENGVQALERVIDFYESKLPRIINNKQFSFNCPSVNSTTASIQSLINYIEKTLLPTASSGNAKIGQNEYARRLTLYTDSDLTPEQLEAIALTEINTVRQLIRDVSKAYLEKEYPSQKLPNSDKAIIKTAFSDMEKDAPKSGADYLQFWLALEKQAVDFIEKNNIATLPSFQTLRIMPAPESAGAAARIGWVDSAPPFAPNPLTTLYLPSIPDTLPAQEQKDFWASFNKPFNRMIVIHELFPGHYMQIKISRETPHPVRLLFPYAV